MKSKKEGGTPAINPGVCQLIQDAAWKQCGVDAQISLVEGKLVISGCDYGGYLLVKSLAVKDFYFSPTLISYETPTIKTQRIQETDNLNEERTI